jgi:hypothetical protein
MYDKPSLEIVEMNYSVSPGGIDEFEVFDTNESNNHNPPLFSSTSLVEAVEYCYGLGRDFVVRTFAEWEEREMMNA